MAVDTKKTEVENLIAKIKTQQEMIAEQAKISSIDIDLQLDYIRTLYEHYIALKQELVFNEKIEKKSNFSECGTLPLFDNFEKQETKIQEKIPVEERENTMPLFEEKNELEDEEIEESEEFDAEFEDEEDEELKELEEEDEEELEEEDELEEDYEEEEEEEEKEEKEEEEFEQEESLFPEMEIEMNVQTSQDIDIDAIEFDDEYEEESEEKNTDNEDDIEETPILHIGTTGQPRYWGDELDIEPIAGKQESIGDKYISDKPSLNEIVSGFKPDDSIGMKMQHASVSDLMKSIDMNLKFLFVKNLFKGNGSVFTEEINKINSIGKLHEAINYVEEIKEKYNWDVKSEAYSELYKLVLRKYAK